VARDIRHELLNESLRRREPNYYHLLGLQDFEDDQRKIIDAASRVLKRARRLGRTESARIVSRVLRARNTLINAAAKQEYDEQLRAMGAAGPSPEDEGEDPLEFLRRRLESTQTELRAVQGESILPVVMALMALVIIVGSTLMYLTSRAQRESQELTEYGAALDLIRNGQKALAVSDLRKLQSVARSGLVRDLAGSTAAMVERTEQELDRIRKETDRLIDEQIGPCPLSPMIEPCREAVALHEKVTGYLDAGLRQRVSGRLSVTTVPTGVRALVGTKDLGRTPLDERLLPLEAQLGLFPDNRRYESGVVPMRLPPGGTVDFSIELPSLADMFAGEWTIKAGQEGTFVLPVEPEPGTLALERPGRVEMETDQDNPRVVRLKAGEEPGMTAIVLRYRGERFQQRVRVVPAMQRMVATPEGVYAVPLRGAVLLGWNAARETRNVTVTRYEVFRRPDQRGQDKFGEIARVPAPQTQFHVKTPPPRVSGIGDVTKIPERMFWFTDPDVRGERPYLYTVRAHAVDAEPPESELTEPVRAVPIYEVDFRCVGAGGGRARFEVLCWTRQGWRLGAFTTVLGAKIGGRKKVGADTIDFRTDWTFKRLETDVKRTVGEKELLRQVRVTCTSPQGQDVSLWKDEFRFPESEIVRQRMEGGRPVRPEKTEPEVLEPEILRPD
jgi:hypothetical protein